MDRKPNKGSGYSKTSAKDQNFSSDEDNLDETQNTSRQQTTTRATGPSRQPMNYQQLRDWSRVLHNTAPENRFFRQKIPYKTILVVSLPNTHFLGHPVLHWRLLLPVPGHPEVPREWDLGLLRILPSRLHHVHPGVLSHISGHDGLQADPWVQLR